MSQKVEKSCGLQWFPKSELKTFDNLGYSAVYSVGPVKNGMTKVIWGSNLPDRIRTIQNHHWMDIQIKSIDWTAGKLLAVRLHQEVIRLLTAGRRQVRDEWFDVPLDLISKTISVARSNLDIVTITHAEMLDLVSKTREESIQAAVRNAGILHADSSI